MKQSEVAKHERPCFADPRILRLYFFASFVAAVATFSTVTCSGSPK